jgi:hypothetical protein
MVIASAELIAEFLVASAADLLIAIRAIFYLLFNHTDVLIVKECLYEV